MMTKQQFFLLKLTEECVEVAQRAAKQMQFGRDEAQVQGPFSEEGKAKPEAQQSNADRLRYELNDLLAVVTILIGLGEIPDATDEERNAAVARKMEKLNKGLEYSRFLGLVAPEPTSFTVLCSGVFPPAAPGLIPGVHNW